jgi:sugar/nucleoside kinase (ribokinase family)
VTRYLTLGNLLVEDVVLPDGRELPGRLGGDALYAAIGARAFADDVQLVARLGRGFPRALARAVEDARLGAGLIPSRHRSVRLRVDFGVDGGGRFAFHARSGSYEDATPVPEEIPLSLVTGLEAVHIAPVPFPRMERLLAWARPRARLVTVDPHYEHVAGKADGWREALPHVDAFLPSKDEATALLGGWPGPEEAARELAELGPTLVCLKLGADGSIAYRPADGEIVRMPPASADPLDPTGCGDAFCGGFLVGLSESGRLHTALAQGAVAASFAGEGYGAEHALVVDRAEARRRLSALLSAPQIA